MANSKIWDNRIVGYDNLDPRVIKANESNWKRHPPKQREKMLVMLNTIGWVQDVIINKTSGKMVDGHLRVDLAIQAGEATVPVKYVELTEDQEISILTMMDTITSMAVVDFEKYTALVIKTEAEEETPLKQLMEEILSRKPLEPDNRIWFIFELQKILCDEGEAKQFLALVKQRLTEYGSLFGLIGSLVE